MSEAATPQKAPRSRRGLIAAIIAIVIVLLLIAGVLLAANSASGRASDYMKDFAAWSSKDKAALIAASSSVPKGTWDLGDSASKKSLAAQTKGCEAVAARVKVIDRVAERLPTVSGGAFAPFSSKLRRAVDRSDQRQKVLMAYVAKAKAALAQIKRDCEWNIALNRRSEPLRRAGAKSVTYALKDGDREPGGVICDTGSGGTCVSSITKKKNNQVTHYRKALKIRQQTLDELYTSPQCRKTSYGSFCKDFAREYQQDIKADAAWATVVRKAKTSIDNDAIGEVSKKAQARHKLTQKRLIAKFKTKFPAFTGDKELMENPWWTSRFLRTVSAGAVKKLVAEQKVLKSM